MTSCSGCGVVLGIKKYKFHRMWRIPGYYCKKCMLELGKDFDDHGRLTMPTRKCDLCSVDYYFLKSVWEGKKQHHYCDVCHQAVLSGVIPEKGKPSPGKMPQVMMMFAGLGVLMMVLGLVFTLSVSPDGNNIVNILFGATTTALGFVLFKKTIRSRNLLLGKTKIASQEMK
jgi:hypothetical protein